MTEVAQRILSMLIFYAFSVIAGASCLMMAEAMSVMGYTRAAVTGVSIVGAAFIITPLVQFARYFLSD